MVDRKCPVCGNLYLADPVRLRFGRQTTCSRPCSYKLRANKLSKGINLECATCGKKIRRSLSTLKGKHGSNFCSKECHYKGRSIGLSLRVVSSPYSVSEEGRKAQSDAGRKASETRKMKGNYKHTEETKSKLSIATSLAISNGKFPKVSKIEDYVEAELLKMKIKFIRQYYLRNKDGTFACCFDFFLPDYSSAIEVNGTFWHSDPRFYPDGPEFKSQLHNAKAWGKKKQVSESVGIKVYEIWEHDIKENCQQTVLKVISQINRESSSHFRKPNS